MNKLIALAVAVAFASPALAQDAKTAKPATNTTVTAPVAKPTDATKPQPAASKDQKPVEKKDEVKKNDAKGDMKKDAGKPAAPAAGAQPTGTQKTTEKPAETKKQ